MAEKQICRECYFWDGFPESIEALCNLKKDEEVKRFDETCRGWRSNKKGLNFYNIPNPVGETEPADAA